jgi:hypothetical protein
MDAAMKRRGRVLTLRITNPKVLELIERKVRELQKEYGGAPIPSRAAERLILEGDERKDGD